MSLQALSAIARDLGAKTTQPSITVNGKKGFKCFCPVHSDNKSPNLDIWLDNKGLLAAHCHACQNNSEITKKLRDKYIKYYPPLFHKSKEVEKVRDFVFAEGVENKPENTNFTLSAWRKSHPSFCQPVSIYKYHHTNGDLFCYVARYERPGEKRFCQWTYQTNKRTKEHAWKQGLGGYDEKRPLYNIHVLSDKPVLLVEGEKAADRAKELLPQYDVVCYMGGAQSWNKADLKPLEGKNVKLWYDNDYSGVGYNEFVKLANTLLGYNCFVELVILPKDKRLSDHWDLGDATEDDTWINNVGWTDRYERLLWQLGITEVNYATELPKKFIALPGSAALNTFLKIPRRQAGQISLPYQEPCMSIQEFKRLVGKSKLCVSEIDASKVHFVDSCIEQELFEYYTDYTFDPNTTDYMVKRNEKLYWNIYTGLPYEGIDDKEILERAMTYIENLLGTNVCKWFINYIAHAIQFPSHKPSTALTMIGDQGVGKTILFEFLAKLFGTTKESPDGYAFICNDIGMIMQSHFTGLFGKLLFLADEAGAMKNANVVLKVDGEITSNITTVNPKNKPMASIPNYTRWIFATNERNTKLRDGDRRHVLAEVATMNPEHERWSDIVKFFHAASTCQAFMHYLRNYEVDESMVHEALSTERKVMTVAKADKFKMLAYKWLTEGEINIQLRSGQMYTIDKKAWDTGMVCIPMPDMSDWLVKDKHTWLGGTPAAHLIHILSPQTSNALRNKTATSWNSLYNKGFFEQDNAKQPRLNKNINCWKIMPHAQCCAHFYNETGILIDNDVEVEFEEDDE